MSSRTKELTFIALFSALIVVCSWISVPLTVPITLQTFAVFTACGCLGGRMAAISVIVYIFLGVIGLPVFSGFKGGIGIVFGVTGGYIVGFVLCCLTVWGITKLFGTSTAVFAISCLVGLLICYLFGTLWFVFIGTEMSLSSMLNAFKLCVLPFIIPDIIKLSLATVVVSRVRLRLMNN